MNRHFLWPVTFFMLAALSSAEAQQPEKPRKIGVFLPASASATAGLVEAFRQGLREHGYVGKQNLTLEPRYAEGKIERLGGLAAEFVRLKVDVIVVGSTPGAMAAKNATGAIPIVIVTTGDPVASGLIDSLARPGGNITGLTALGQELGGKRLEVLKEAVPKVSRGGRTLESSESRQWAIAKRHRGWRPSTGSAASSPGGPRSNRVREGFRGHDPRGSQGAYGATGPDVR